MQLQNIIPVEVPEKVLQQIKYLCKNIAADEWSGVLFYKIEGSIKNPETFKIILEGILPMDKGSSVYTAYNLDDRFIDYLMEDEERLDWKVGHIHSHNVMEVYFSGTDKEELYEGCENHNFYLSMIVNDYMDMIAKVATVANIDHELVSVPYKAQDENGEFYEIQVVDLNYNKKKVFVYDCKILHEAEIVVVEDDFASRVAEIMKPKPKPVSQYKPVTNQKKTPQLPPAKGGSYNSQKDFNRKKFVKDFVEEEDFKAFNPYEGLLDELEDFDDADTLLSRADVLEVFTAQLFKFDGEICQDESLEDVLDAMFNINNGPDITNEELAKRVLEAYPGVYEKFFKDADDKDFLLDLFEVTDILYDEVALYPFINETIEALIAMGKKFKENASYTTV